MLKQYVVIGGQYESYCYGSSDTLNGAKILASKSLEYWDNWQGFRYPSIYRREDVKQCNNFYGETYCPKAFAHPVAIRNYGERWIVTE